MKGPNMNSSGSNEKAIKPGNTKGDDYVSIDTEYEQCLESWRFYLGLRPAILVFALSVMSAGIYFLMGKDNSPGPIAKILLSLGGFIITVAVFMFEWRTRDLYDVCIKRARALELGGNSPPEFLYGTSFSKMWECTRDAIRGKAKEVESNNHRLATLLINKPRHLLSWQTGAIYLTYGVMGVAWLVMLLCSVLDMVKVVITGIFHICCQF
jgi:hypothetical protein